MIAAPARIGKWLDVDIPCSASVLAAVRAAGYQGVLRYLPLPGNSAVHDISASELERTIAADLQCGLVQHCRRGLVDPLGQDRGIDASEHDGRADALYALACAKLAGYPVGCHAWVDLENLGRSTAASVAHYENEWAQAWLEEQFLAAAYVGFGIPMNAAQLFHDLRGTSYWSDAAHRHVDVRGCAIVQGHTVTIGGVEFDEDFVAPDLLGCLPMVASPDAPTIHRVLA